MFDYKKAIIKEIKMINPSNLSYVYNKIMKMLDETTYIWSYNHLIQDISNNVFADGFDIQYHLNNDNIHRLKSDTEYIGICDNDFFFEFTNISYDEAITQLEYKLTYVDENLLAKILLELINFTKAELIVRRVKLFK